MWRYIFENQAEGVVVNGFLGILVGRLVRLGWKFGFSGFPAVLRFHKNFNFFRRQKNIFFRVQKFSHTLFSKKNPTIFRNLKNIGIFQNKKNENFLNSNFEFTKISLFLFLKFPIFFRFRKNVWFFSRKRCTIFLNSKKYIFCRRIFLKFLWNLRTSVFI